MMNTENKCVYIFLDHRKPGKYIYDDLEFDFEPIYVGKGNSNRPKGHKYSIKKKTRFYNKYNKILEETNEPPKFLIIKNKLEESEANKLESEIIKKIGKIENGGSLTNLTDGGDHNGGFKVNISVINQRTETIKNSIEYLNTRKERFIKKSTDLHKNKYDYHLVDYKSAKINVNIICPIHGIFEQTPTSHLMGKGCQKCGGNIKKNTINFIKIAKEIHGEKYDYSLSNYDGANKKIKIICNIHGWFEQSPNCHINRKHGCPKCGQKQKKIPE